MQRPKSFYLYYQPVFFCGYDETKHGIQPPEPTIVPTLRLWIRHPARCDVGYQLGKTFPLQLDRTPGLAETDGLAATITVDDHTDSGGYTTIGPCFPHAYSSGGVYLSERTWKKAVHCHNHGCHGACGDQFDEHVIALPPHDERVLVEWIPDPDAKHELKFRPKRYHGFYGQRLTHTDESPSPTDESPSPTDGSPPPDQHASLWIVGHSGAYYKKDEKEHWRAPRKLWIHDAVKRDAPPQPGAGPAGKDAAPQSLYLEQSYATFVANLDVPKQPSASGERSKFSVVRTVVRNLDQPGSRWCHEPETPNLNVVSEYAPGEVLDIKNRLKNYLEVEGAETLVDALSRYLKHATTLYGDELPQFDNLDIIGHSRSRDRIIKIGEFALTSRVAREQFRKLYGLNILQALGIKAIRLLGCRTASLPRGERVVRTIANETGLDVYATRADLFAVHFGASGLRKEAKPLLANYDVITYAGPGDLPPRDDYPAPPPADDDDYDNPDVVKNVLPPERLTLTALSDVNAAAVSAKHYLFWKREPSAFDRLVEMVHANDVERDNRLERADCEVLLSIASDPTDISDFRSFDLFVEGKHARLRTNYDGVSYAFRFRKCQDLRGELKKLRIDIPKVAFD